MGLQILTPASGFPLTLDAIKAYLRITWPDEDALVSQLLAFAAGFIERETTQQMLTATKRLYLDSFPRRSMAWDGRFETEWGGSGYAELHRRLPSHESREIRLATPPLQSVTSVNYLVNGTPTVLDPSLYTVDAVSKPGRIVLNQFQVWPASDRNANAVWIDFVCGYGDAAAVPPEFGQAILWMVAHCYENRLPVSELKMEELPMGLRAVIETLMFREAHGA